MKESNTALVRSYFNSLILNDVQSVRSCFSNDSKVHNGYYIDDFIMAEMNEFNQYSRYYDLQHNNFEVIPTFQSSNEAYYSVLNHHGKLVFDHGVNVINDKIVSDGSFYQKVTKNKYKLNCSDGHKSFYRSVAIWCPYSSESPQFVIVKPSDTKGVYQGNLRKSASTEKDGFYSFEFFVSDDDKLSHTFGFRFIDKKYSESSNLYFSGENHPYFFDDMYPELVGSKLKLNHVDTLIWSVAVYLENGKYYHIEFPRVEEIEFEANIVKAIVTDALDNDWETSWGH